MKTAHLKDERMKTSTFLKVTNDGQMKSLQLLLSFKNLISKQLPKMQKEHIVRLVFDSRHTSIILLNGEGQIIGGVCFRIFDAFVEIAFLVVRSSDQIKGNGSLLINKFKEQMKKKDIEHVITFADNFALGFFRKQGFVTVDKTKKHDWQGCIKEYDCGTLMQCRIYKEIDYFEIKNIIKKQREKIAQYLKNMLLNDIEFSGPKPTNKTKFKIKYGNKKTEEFLFDPMNLEGIPQSGWTWNQFFQFAQVPQISFNDRCKYILNNLVQHPSSWPFRHPVSREEVPEYYKLVKQPMDLKTMLNKVMKNMYQTEDQFKKDIRLIIQNCKEFNFPETVYYKCAEEIESYINCDFKTLLLNRKIR